MSKVDWIYSFSIQYSCMKERKTANNEEVDWKNSVLSSITLRVGRSQCECNVYYASVQKIQKSSSEGCVILSLMAQN